jgi:probable F420-dependent oxidoreductase
LTNRAGSGFPKLGKLGLWGLFSHLSADAFAALARTAEAWGYGALWLPEAFGRDLLVASSFALASTERLCVATGIANIYARDSVASVNAQYGLAEQSDGRFLLGLGVSHQAFVEQVRGHPYQKPIAAMRTYLQAMANVQYLGAPPAEKPKAVLAALGPQMLRLAADLADGAHTYNVNPDHTAQARAILGPQKLLCPEQKVLLETDPATARSIGRRVLSYSLPLPNYRNSFLRMGFGEEDLQGGGSDRLIDSIIAWGDEDAIRARIQEHWDAGADHVCIQSLPREGMSLGPEDQRIFELLAPAQARPS